MGLWWRGARLTSDNHSKRANSFARASSAAGVRANRTEGCDEEYEGIDPGWRNALAVGDAASGVHQHGTATVKGASQSRHFHPNNVRTR